MTRREFHTKVWWISTRCRYAGWDDKMTARPISQATILEALIYAWAGSCYLQARDISDYPTPTPNPDGSITLEWSRDSSRVLYLDLCGEDYEILATYRPSVLYATGQRPALMKRRGKRLPAGIFYGSLRWWLSGGETMKGGKSEEEEELPGTVR